MERIRKNHTRVDLIMLKYCLFIQRRERFKVSRIPKRALNLTRDVFTAAKIRIK